MTVQHVPSNAGKGPQAHNDAVDVARDSIDNALMPYFKGKTAKVRRDGAVTAVLNSIVGLITVRQVSGQKLGGTVMTEAASMRNPKTGDYSKAPRNL